MPRVLSKTLKVSHRRVRTSVSVRKMTALDARALSVRLSCSYGPVTLTEPWRRSGIDRARDQLTYFPVSICVARSSSADLKRVGNTARSDRRDVFRRFRASKRAGIILLRYFSHDSSESRSLTLVLIVHESFDMRAPFDPCRELNSISSRWRSTTKQATPTSTWRGVSRRARENTFVNNERRVCLPTSECPSICRFHREWKHRVRETPTHPLAY